MTNEELRAITEGMAPAIRDYVAESIRELIEPLHQPILAKIAVLDARRSDKGDPGPAGRDGNPGPAGRDGKDGVPGVKGERGDKGDPGPAGRDGDPGPVGRDGVQGPQGAKGEKGEKGDKGDPGSAGRDGNQGLAGRDGAQGPQGLKGDKGEAGTRGEKGDLGPVGRDGAPGAQGLKGDKGEAGTRGEKGDLGPAGRDGAPGKDGVSLGEIDVRSDDDGRTLIFLLPGGRERRIKTAILIDCGVWTERAYERGDGVTHDGSFWIAQCDTQPTDKPGISKVWRLAVRKGRNGRDSNREGGAS